MKYGVVLVKDFFKIWKTTSADVLFDNGCEAVFILESDARSYAYEQAEMRKLKVDNSPTIDFVKFI